jgi:hypothetical protein
MTSLHPQATFGVDSAAFLYPGGGFNDSDPLPLTLRGFHDGCFQWLDCTMGFIRQRLYFIDHSSRWV